MLKFTDKIYLENVLFVSKCLNNLLPALFCDRFIFLSDQYNYDTSWSSHCKLKKPSYRTNMYDKNSFKASEIESWNKTQNQLKDVSFKLLSATKIKSLIFDAFLKNC